MVPEAELLSAPPAPAGVVVVPEAQPPAMGQLASDDGDVLCVLGVLADPAPSVFIALSQYRVESVNTLQHDMCVTSRYYV